MTDGSEAPLGDGRVLIVGAGSLGSVYAGFLGRGGADVQCLAREEHARAIRDQGGLRVVAGDDAWLAPVRATWRSREVEPAEVVIVLTKTPDTAGALAGLDHILPHVRVVVSLQNGIDEAGHLAAWAGAGSVIGGVSMVGGTLERPGHARHTLVGTTFLGETPTGVSPRVRDLGALLDAAGLPVVVTDRIASVEWSKLVHGAPSMSLTALTRRWFHEVFLAPELAEVFLDQLVEGVSIARAHGVEVDDWPGLLPLRTIANESREDGLARIRTHGEKLVERGMTQIRISMLQSIERGRHIEVEAIFGVLARAADRHGVEAPVTRTLYRLLAGLDRYLT